MLAVEVLALLRTNPLEILVRSCIAFPLRENSRLSGRKL